MLVVFYDGNCGLCSKEIKYYKKIAPAGQFQWLDIFSNAEALKKTGISTEQALKELHVIDPTQKCHIGVDAFIQIWRRLPKWRYLAFFVNLPIIHFCSSKIYKLFARWRFKKLRYCDLA